MATIGQVLIAPESGWKRIDNTDANLTYEGSWSPQVLSSHYNNSLIYTNSKGSKIKFNFTGDKIRLILNNYTNNETATKVSIDGVSTTVNSRLASGELFQVLAYEKLGLANSQHLVEIETVSNDYFRFDALDISDTGEILPYRELYKKAILKNPSTNQYYSLADKTLILLPDGSDETMINYGIEAGKEIQLDEDFDKINYLVDLDGVTVNADGFYVSNKDTTEKPLSIKFEQRK